MRCSFEFDRRDPIFFSGETISGRAILTTKSEHTVNEISTLFVGEGKVRFQDLKELSLTGHQLYRGRQTYLNARTVVFEGGTLPSGTHIYPFSFIIPLDCPSSVVVEYGRIWYEIKLCVDLQQRSNKVFTKPLTVLQTYNLNMSPQLLIPLVREDLKHFCCWHCRSGPVLWTLTIPFGGYAPGQKIRFNLEVDNQSSSRDVVGIILGLNQSQKLQGQTPQPYLYKNRHTLTESYKRSKVKRLSKGNIEGTLTIPALPPTSRENAIISVSYDVHMKIDLNDCYGYNDSYMPIIIGTIPLIQSAEDPTYAAELIAQTTNTRSTPGTSNTPDTPSTPETPAGSTADLPPDYENYGPPTFEEAIMVGKTFIDVDGENSTDEFVPRYPMYTNFGTTPPPNSEEASSALL